jgi:hypothetical protein
MSGTGASKRGGSGGLAIPQPNIRIQTLGQGAGSHDRVWAGGMTNAEFAALEGREISLWLLRYKRGYRSSQAPHSGYQYNNTQGFVHPSNWLAGGNTGRNVGGGKHTTRQGGTIPDRQTEWVVTAPHHYDAEFKPENWFLDNSASAQSFPISDYTRIGKSGQAGKSGAFFSPAIQNNAGSCNRETSFGSQRQVFAFCYAVRDENDRRNWIRGAMSEMVVAEIFPKMKISYCVAQLGVKGRKIKLTIESK